MYDIARSYFRVSWDLEKAARVASQDHRQPAQARVGLPASTAVPRPRSACLPRRRCLDRGQPACPDGGASTAVSLPAPTALPRPRSALPAPTVGLPASVASGSRMCGPFAPPYRPVGLVGYGGAARGAPAMPFARQLTRPPGGPPRGASRPGAGRPIYGICSDIAKTRAICRRLPVQFNPCSLGNCKSFSISAIFLISLAIPCHISNL